MDLFLAMFPALLELQLRDQVQSRIFHHLVVNSKVAHYVRWPPIWFSPGKEKIINKWVFPKIGVPQIIHFNRVFHYKPSILVVFPLFLETPKSFSSPSFPKVPTNNAGRFNFSQDLLLANEPRFWANLTDSVMKRRACCFCPLGTLERSFWISGEVNFNNMTPDHAFKKRSNFNDFVLIHIFLVSWCRFSSLKSVWKICVVSLLGSYWD